MKNNIEQDYYKVLKSIAARSTPGKPSARELPHILEKASWAHFRKNTRYILSGISGSGKTTIAKILEKKGFKKLPNITTRARRSEEKDSDAVFVTEKVFKEWKRQNMIFHPHRRNKVWQGILKGNLRQFTGRNGKWYADKSVASAIEISKGFPIVSRTTFLYLLAPTFKDLKKRMVKREDERRKRGEKALSRRDILDRFAEEIVDMRRSAKLPYAYLVNDDLKRLKRLLR